MKVPTDFIRRSVFATDHKTVGIQYLFMGLLFLALGGGLALMMRWQLAWPVEGLSPEQYNALFSLHATVMIFFVIIPLLVSAFGNYLIPLEIGARQSAFPFLSGWSLWITILAGMVLLAGPFLTGGAVEAGWTGYPPLSALWGAGSTPYLLWPIIPTVIVYIAAALVCGYLTFHWFRGWLAAAAGLVGAAVVTLAIEMIAFDGQSCWFLSLLLVSFASLMIAINFLTTIVLLRCPGMTLLRLPLTIWAYLFTAILSLLATPVLIAAMVMNLLDHHRFTSFFLPASWAAESQIHPAVSGGGYALLHQHLFWFYSHPAVYIMILPAFGMVSEILSVFSRKPIFGYLSMVVATGAITFLGFFVWAHHMFVSGMNPLLGTTFALSTMLIAVPSGVKVFNWIATLWGGSIHLTTALWNAVAFVSLFTIGGLSGIFLASTPVNIHLHDTYFVVAHIHYVLFGGSMFGLFGAIYFWYPKFFGRMMNETWGKVHFFVSFVAFNGVFFPMHILGIRGVPRRFFDITTMESFKDLQPLNVFMTFSALLLGLAQIPFIINFLGSLRWGQRAEGNPWRAATLEWTDAPSPPPVGNFESTPVVYRGAYEYNNPQATEDFLPQSQPA